MINLWRAEWLKTRKRPANLGILFVTMGIVVLAIAGFVGVALYNGKGSMEYFEALEALPYPNGLSIPILILGALGNLLGIVFIANSVGSEYSRDTWKMILPRRGSRLSFITVKLLMAVVCMLLFIVAMMVVSQIVAWIGLLILGGNLTASGGPTLLDQIKSIFSNLLQMVFYGILTLLAAVVTRSTIGGIVAGFIASQVLGLVSIISSTIGRILPSLHLSNLNAHWVIRNDDMIDAINQQLGGAISPYVSLAVVLGYTAAFLAFSMWLFKRRDQAGN